MRVGHPELVRFCGGSAGRPRTEAGAPRRDGRVARRPGGPGRRRSSGERWAACAGSALA